ncbi:hypothetical protein OHU34_25570 [Streptomyces sp. NBC_00080]|uniref:hypothetical protein n=1 Tax=Streptomyces sp. NBC_00080 TaxID=2975645 RepID=UPI003252403F
MRDWRRVLLTFDRFVGSGQPPTRFEVAMARHPVRAGVICGAVMTVLVALALSGSGDPVVLLQAALTGIGVGFFCWAVCRLTRSQHAYYERIGRFHGARQQARQAEAETMSPQMHVLLLVGGWVLLSGVFWLISPLIDMPRSVPWSAFFGGLLLGSAIMVQWIKRERS